VEGFSAFAISYYAVSLIKLAVDGLPALGFPDAPKWASIIAVPAIAVAIWLSIRRLRRSLAGSTDP
jgi:uncharacterized membrane-anchored protein